MKSADKREGILQAASETFARFGYEKTTLDDIGRAVGLNKASLYYYYKNKEELFTEVILKESSIYIRSLHEKVQKFDSVTTKIIEYLIERFAYYKQVVNLHQLSLDTLRKVEPLFDKLYQQVLDKEIEFLETLVSELITPEKKPDTRRIAKSLLTIADGIKIKLFQDSGVQYASEVDYSRIEDEIRYVTSIFLKGIQA